MLTWEDTQKFLDYTWSFVFTFEVFVPIAIGVATLWAYFYITDEDYGVSKRAKRLEEDIAAIEERLKASRQATKLSPPPSPTGDLESSNSSDMFRRRKIASISEETADEEKLTRARDLRLDALLFHNRNFPQLRDLKNREAASLFIEAYNAQRPLHELDLHELFVEEAERCVRERVEELQQKGGYSTLKLIVGNASNKGKETSARLRKPITNFVSKELGLNCSEDPNRAGCLIVSLK